MPLAGSFRGLAVGTGPGWGSCRCVYECVKMDTQSVSVVNKKYTNDILEVE